MSPAWRSVESAGAIWPILLERMGRPESDTGSFVGSWLDCFGEFECGSGLACFGNVGAGDWQGSIVAQWRVLF
jgi:hypothetical protein